MTAREIGQRKVYWWIGYNDSTPVRLTEDEVNRLKNDFKYVTAKFSHTLIALDSPKKPQAEKPKFSRARPPVIRLVEHDPFFGDLSFRRLFISTKPFAVLDHECLLVLKPVPLNLPSRELAELDVGGTLKLKGKLPPKIYSKLLAAKLRET
jgi:hypothetical protein